MRHFLSTQSWSRDDLQAMIERARAYRSSPQGDALRGKSIALLFFNPSLRTRTSFDLGAHQLGGHAIVLDAKGSTWPVEIHDGAIMDGGPEEHVKEAARVLSSYVDLIAIRCFPKFENWQAEREDPLIEAYAKHASVPVINMETIVHPCQELAMMMAMQDKMGDVKGKNFLLTWVPHPKPLNTAVANSAILMASKMGMNVQVLIPDEAYQLDARYSGAARGFCEADGHSFGYTTDVEAAYSGAHMVYAKSWGALPFYGRWDDEAPVRAKGSGFMIDEAKMAMTDSAYVSHCLPMRRNVKISDAVVDSDRFLGLAEAENRLHVQKAMMEALLAHPDNQKSA